MTWQACVFLGFFLYSFSYMILDDFLYAKKKETAISGKYSFVFYLPIVLVCELAWKIGEKMAAPDSDPHEGNVIKLAERKRVGK